jgi:hypothetical protein
MKSPLKTQSKQRKNTKSNDYNMFRCELKRRLKHNCLSLRDYMNNKDEAISTYHFQSEIDTQTGIAFRGIEYIFFRTVCGRTERLLSYDVLKFLLDSYKAGRKIDTIINLYEEIMIEEYDDHLIIFPDEERIAICNFDMSVCNL